MAKTLKFYDPKKGKPTNLSNYTVKTISTPKGKRKQAIGRTRDGRKLYRLVAMDFKK